MTERGLPVGGSGEEVTPPSQAPAASQTGNWLLGTSSPPFAFSNFSQLSHFHSLTHPRGPACLSLVVPVSPEPSQSQKCWGKMGEKQPLGIPNSGLDLKCINFPFLEVRGNSTMAGEPLWGARRTEKLSGSLAGVGLI